MNRRWWLAFAVMGAVGCGDSVESVWVPREPEVTVTFEEFERAHRGPSPGTYIVEGDILITGAEELEVYFRERYRTYGRVSASTSGEPLGSQSAELNINLIELHDDCVWKQGKDRCWDRWSDGMKHQLTYCVSTRFDTHHADVVTAMKSAACEWSTAADVTFRHVPSMDGDCSLATVAGGLGGIVFTVEPVDPAKPDDPHTGQRIGEALAFFPSDAPEHRRVWLRWNRLEQPVKNVLLHELGHVLGFRHEHLAHGHSTEERHVKETDWFPLTDSPRGKVDDPWSVMHYLDEEDDVPLNHTRYSLSLRDKQGAARVYSKPAHDSKCPK